MFQEETPERAYLLNHDVRKFMKESSHILSELYYVRTDDSSPRMTDRKYFLAIFVTFELIGNFRMRKIRPGQLHGPWDALILPLW